jgi:hypothetical protein
MRTPVLVAMLLIGCAVLPEGVQPPQDKALARALVGAWCNSDDDGRTCWAYDVFSEDGTLRACGQFPDQKRPFDGAGRVSIAGSVMCYRVLNATENFWVKPGSTYCTRILEISSTAHTYQDLESGAKFKLLRVPNDAVKCLARAQ